MANIKQLRQQYSDEGINRETVDGNPFEQFKLWYEQAIDSGMAESNGFSLSTVSENSSPTQRTVLMKSFDENGFVFYSNYTSRKGHQLEKNQHVSMLFPWYGLHRQVIIEGRTKKAAEKQSYEYFKSRPQSSQIGAWASRQSEILASRYVLEQQVNEVTEKFKNQDIPLPTFWGGYLIEPHRFEFWQGRNHRLHDRIVYTKLGGDWELTRLSP